MKERESLVTTGNCGKDEASAKVRNRGGCGHCLLLRTSKLVHMTHCV